MTYHIEWLEPQRIIQITYTDQITVQDLEAVNRDLAAYHDEGIAPIHVVSYLETNQFPTHIKAVREVLQTLSHDKWGWFVVAGFENSLGRFLMTVVTNTFKLQAKAVDTVGDAVAHLKRVDFTLPDMVDV